jgi:hypothetical protein
MSRVEEDTPREAYKEVHQELYGIKVEGCNCSE